MHSCAPPPSHPTVIIYFTVLIPTWPPSPAFSSPLVMHHILPAAEWFISHLCWRLEAKLNLGGVGRFLSPRKNPTPRWQCCSHFSACLIYIYTVEPNWDYVLTQQPSAVNFLTFHPLFCCLIWARQPRFMTGSAPWSPWLDRLMRR